MNTVKFAGYSWNIKSADEKLGPGPNFFSEKNVFLDEKGLHLVTRLSKKGTWQCAEVVLKQPLGYGEYIFQINSPLYHLDRQTVFAGFLYENDTEEIDIEFSAAMAGMHGAQYIIQPGSEPGNLLLYKIPDTNETSHKILWLPDHVEFTSWLGHDPESDSEIIQHWIYPTSGITTPDKATFIFNLWLYEGKDPESSIKVIVKNFHFYEK